MDKIMGAISWAISHKAALIVIYVFCMGVASIIVRFTPTLKDDNILKNIIKFLGKYIALNRTQEAKLKMKATVLEEITALVSDDAIKDVKEAIDKMKD